MENAHCLWPRPRRPPPPARERDCRDPPKHSHQIILLQNYHTPSRPPNTPRICSIFIASAISTFARPRLKPHSV
jgi:hypothetical protein